MTRSYVSWSYGFVVTLLNIIVSLVQGWTSTNVEVGACSSVGGPQASPEPELSLLPSQKWSTVSDREASDNVKISMFYIVNSFVIPVSTPSEHPVPPAHIPDADPLLQLLAAYVQFDAGKDLDQFEVEADGQALWYIEGGVVTSLFWIQVGCLALPLFLSLSANSMGGGGQRRPSCAFSFVCLGEGPLPQGGCLDRLRG